MQGTLVPKLTLGPFLTLSVRNVKHYFVILAPPFNSHLVLCVPPQPLLYLLPVRLRIVSSPVAQAPFIP